MEKIKVAKVTEVLESGIKKVEVDGEAVALYKIGGQIYATTNVCSHTGCDLDENHQITGDIVECTCHGSQFNVKTGAVVLPPATEPLKTYSVSVEGEDVFVES